jgi:hypothetical protein
VTNIAATTADVNLVLTGPTLEHINAVSGVTVIVEPKTRFFRGVTTPNVTYTLSAQELEGLKAGTQQTVSLSGLVENQTYTIAVNMTGIEQPHYAGISEFVAISGVDINNFIVTQIEGTDDVKFSWSLTPKLGYVISKIEIKEGETVLATPMVGDETVTIGNVSKGSHTYTMEVTYAGVGNGTASVSAIPIVVIASGEVNLNVKNVGQDDATLEILPSKLSHTNAISAVNVVVTPKNGASLATIAFDDAQLASLNSGNGVDIILSNLEAGTKYDVSVSVSGLDNIVAPITTTFTTLPIEVIIPEIPIVALSVLQPSKTNDVKLD